MLDRAKWRTTKMTKGLQHICKGRGWESWDCLARRRGGSGRISWLSINTCREDGASLFSVVPCAKTRGTKWEVPSEHQELLFHCKGKYSWRYSEAVWMWSWATVSVWPWLSRGVGPDNLQTTFQHQPSCDFVEVGGSVQNLNSSWSTEATILACSWARKKRWVQNKSSFKCLKVLSVTDLVLNLWEKGEKTGIELFICSQESLVYLKVGWPDISE